MKIILVAPGENLKLQELCNCSETTVTSALRFRTNGKKAIKVRNMALARGGKETQITK